MLTTEKIKIRKTGGAGRDPENPTVLIGIYSVIAEMPSNPTGEVARIEATFDDEGTKPTPLPNPINCYAEGTSLCVFKNDNVEILDSAIGLTYNVTLRLFNSLGLQVGNTVVLAVVVEDMPA